MTTASNDPIQGWRESKVRVPGIRQSNTSSGPVEINDVVHGTCSKCGGAVVTPRVFHSTAVPVPTCKRCGAHPKQHHGPVIEME